MAFRVKELFSKVSKHKAFVPAVVLILALVIGGSFILWEYEKNEGFQAGPVFQSCLNENKVKWQNDPSMFQSYQQINNPFAKSMFKHCTTDTQCRTGTCDQWYCVGGVRRAQP